MNHFFIFKNFILNNILLFVVLMLFPGGPKPVTEGREHRKIEDPYTKCVRLGVSLKALKSSICLTFKILIT